jgi:alpha-N-arabinofuranosidase
VTWKNDWPVILEHGVALPRIHPRLNLPPETANRIPTSGSFDWQDDFSAPILAREWNFLRTPREAWWSLKDGSLFMTPRPVALNSVHRKDMMLNGNPSFLGRRRQHHDFTATTTLVLHSSAAPYDAGLAALQNDANYLFLGVRATEGQGQEVFLEQQTEETGHPEILATMPLAPGTKRVGLKMSADGRTCSFSFQAERGNWTTLKLDVDGGSLSSRGVSFVGSYLGLYARTATEENLHP